LPFSKMELEICFEYLGYWSLLSHATGSSPLYRVIRLWEIPEHFHAENGITQGQKSRANNGIVSFVTAVACGESLKPTCLIPRPKDTLLHSGDENETATDGSNFFTS